MSNSVVQLHVTIAHPLDTQLTQWWTGISYQSSHFNLFMFKTTINHFKPQSYYIYIKNTHVTAWQLVQMTENLFDFYFKL